MRIRRTAEDSDDTIDTSALVDIMFILIIFFLVATTFREEERDIKVNLPETDARSLSSAVKAMVINVRKDGTYYLGAERLDIVNLHKALMDAAAANADQKILIRGDRNALHGYVAAAVAACRKVGIREANIGYVGSMSGK